MKQKIFITVFLTILILPSLLWVIIKGSHNDNLISHFEYDLGENRALATMPDEISLATITSDIDNYYSDHVPFRTSIISLHSKLDGSLEDIYRKGIQPSLIKLAGKESGSTLGLSVAELTGKDEDTASVKSDSDLDNAKLEDSSEHSYVVIEEVEPSCTEDGYRVIECSDCKDLVTETLAATGHSPEAVDVVEASYESYGRTKYKCSVCDEMWFDDFADKLVDDSYLPVNVVNNQVIIGKSDWLFYTGDNSIAYYTGENVLSESSMADRLSKMHDLKDACDEKGIELLFMVFPNKEQVYPEYMPTIDMLNEDKRLPVFEEYVNENSDINFVYPLSELMSAKIYYDTYFPYDTHWNNWGAFVATQAMYEALDMERTPLEQVDVARVDGFVRGLVATGALDPDKFVGDSDYEIDYRPYAGSVTTFGVKGMMNGYTTAYQSVSNTPLTDKNIVFLGDSFRVSMIPFVEKDFAFTTFVQRENWDEMSEALLDADVLVVAAVERFDNDIFKRIPSIAKYIREN